MPSSFLVDDLPQVRGYTVEWVDAEGFILSRRNHLYQSADLKPPFKLLATYPAGYQGLRSHSPLFQRLFRFLYYNVIKLADERLFVTFQKNVGLFEAGKFVPLSGLVRPARILRGACAVDSAGHLYFGEYISNPDRGVIRVYHLAPGARHLEVVHQFQPGTIRHVHGLYHDPYDRSI